MTIHLNQLKNKMLTKISQTRHQSVWDKWILTLLTVFPDNSVPLSKHSEQTGTDSNVPSTKIPENHPTVKPISGDTSTCLIGHIELAEPHHTSLEDSCKSIIENYKQRFLVVRVKKYPNLLKRYQEGNVTIRQECPQFKRLSKI